jgi:hypothetical protein
VRPEPIDKEDRRDTAIDLRENVKAKAVGFRAVFVRVDAWRRCFVCRHRVRPRVGHYEATGPTVFNDGTFYLAHVCKECWDER